MKTCMCAALIGLGVLSFASVEGAGEGKVTPALKERFLKEIWPLLHRGGKDGCVGCHDKGNMSTLHFSGKPEADFAMLVKLDFFLLDDPGSLLNRVAAKGRRRMPPGPRPSWSAGEIETLRKFTADLKMR